MGPLFNLFFGIVLFFMMNLIGYTTETNRIIIPEAFKSGEYIAPSYSAGLRDGDRIIAINNKEVTNFSEIQSNVVFSEGKAINVKVERQGKIRNFTVTPEKYTAKSYYTIGVLPYGKSILLTGTLKDDVASKAGIEQYDEIKSINGKEVTTPGEFVNIIRNSPGKELDFRINRAGKEINLTVIPRLKEVLTINQFEDGHFKGEKYDISIDKMDMVRNAIKKGRLKINNITITSFSQFRNILKENRDKVISLTNSGGTYYGKMSYDEFGFIGVETAISPDMIQVNHGIAGSMWRAVVEPYYFIVMNIKGMGMLFSGELDVRQNLSGPIRIAKIAGDVAYYKGISAFILLMAKISIILMVMNLLPIPVVDGSFILFFLIEAVRGKPISQKIMEKIQFVGVIMLIAIGIFVVFNDLSFFPFFKNLFN